MCSSRLSLQATQWVLVSPSAYDESTGLCRATLSCCRHVQAMVAYLFGCELKDRQTGLLAAAIMAIVPGQLN